MYFRFSSIAFCISFIIFFFCLLFPVHGRWHNHAKKHKQHSHHHDDHYFAISQPPSTSPSPASPPGDDDDNGGSSSSINFTGIFDVRHFGAIGDGTTDDTAAFKMAWDTACQRDDNDNDYAIILVPYGFSFMIQSTIFTGPCKNDIVFQVDGSLIAPDGPDAWPKSYSAHQWLVFYRVYNMSLRGNGLIDGRGQKWWDLPCKPHKVRDDHIFIVLNQINEN